MRHSEQVVSELTNELAIALLLERRSEDPETKAKVLIETLRTAGEKTAVEGLAQRGSDLPSFI